MQLTLQSINLLPPYVSVSDRFLSFSFKLDAVRKSSRAWQRLETHKLSACPAFRERLATMNAGKVAHPVLTMVNPVHSGTGNFPSWLKVTQ